jgi:hypothetical protein
MQITALMATSTPMGSRQLIGSTEASRPLRSAPQLVVQHSRRPMESFYSAQGDYVSAGISYAAAGVGLISDAGVVKLGAKAVKEGAALAKEAAAADRAVQLASTMTARTQRSVTIAVTETEEGVSVVSSSEGTLRPATRAALQDGELSGRGAKGAHAEVNGVNASRGMGLTPTGTAASRPVCSSCASYLQSKNVKILSDLES